MLFAHFSIGLIDVTQTVSYQCQSTGLHACLKFYSAVPFTVFRRVKRIAKSD